ncbi:MAG: hemolysin III family protein [Bacillota bacterium]|nr:hemolysin III family protein [Bacillota bacterium]MDD3851701.1 hemolysin III family protein [Bacillota bacterium]MDD4708326.1 hemolysin III family protein [Bacillota bacterium]
MAKMFREPVSGLSHLVGALLSVAALAVMLYVAIANRNVWQIVAFSIFGSSMILLYSASAIYHLVNTSVRAIGILRKLDHSMIFVLIAGTYTPICLILLRGIVGYSMLSVIWSCAIIGIVLKMYFMNVPRWLYTGVYLLMGWLALVVIVPLFKVAGIGAVLWLLIGGLFYTLGGVIYAIKKPNIIPHWLGFHEIFHVFTMLGSVSHFIMILKFC